MEHHAPAAEHLGQVEHHAQLAAEVLERQAASQALVQTLGRALLAAVVVVREQPELLVRVAREESLESQSGPSAKSLSRERHRA